MPRAEKGAATKKSQAITYFMVTIQSPEAGEPGKDALMGGARLVDKLKNASAVTQDWRYLFQLERGEETGRYHHQMRIDVTRAHRKTCHTLLEELAHILDIDKKWITVRPESNQSVAKAGGIFYVMKAETRMDGPWYDPTFTPPKLQRFVYTGQDVAIVEQSPTPWETTILNALGEWKGEGINRTFEYHRAHDRQLNWIYNEAGGAGKSVFLKYLGYKCGAQALATGGSAGQLKNAVCDNYTKRGNVLAECYYADIPRTLGTQESLRDLFSALEAVKGGKVEGAFYGKDMQAYGMPPHVWITSNMLPDLDLASADRWKVWNLTEMHADLVPMTVREVNKARRLQKKKDLKRKREAEESSSDDDGGAPEVAPVLIPQVDPAPAARAPLNASVAPPTTADGVYALMSKAFMNCETWEDFIRDDNAADDAPPSPWGPDEGYDRWLEEMEP